MIYVIYLFAAVFVVLAAAMLFVFYRSRQIGAFIMGVAYGTTALVAIQLSHWWPLVAGFIIVWMLKLMGLEPEHETNPGENAKSADTKDTKDTKVTENRI